MYRAFAVALLVANLSAIGSAISLDHVVFEKRAACNADNCLRALRAPLVASSATAFCQSYMSIPVITVTVASTTPVTTITTTDVISSTLVSTETDATTTTTTVIFTEVDALQKRLATPTVPAFLSSCSAAASPTRLSSACACFAPAASTTQVTYTAPTSTVTSFTTTTAMTTMATTVTSTETDIVSTTTTSFLGPQCATPAANILTNSDFETGNLSPWTAHLYGNNGAPTYMGISDDGVGYQSALSYKVTNVAADDMYIEQSVNTVVGVSYTMTFQYLVSKVAGGMIQCMQNGNPFATASMNRYNTNANVWTSAGGSFIATTSTTDITCFFASYAETTYLDSLFLSC